MYINSDYTRALLLLLALLPLSASAADPVTRSIIYGSVTYGYYDFAGNRNLDNRDFPGLSIGLQFTDHFSMALYYSSTHVEQKITGSHRRIENYFLEGAWYFNTDSALRPYIVGGLGETLQDEGDLSDVTTVNAGVGIKWRISRHWAAKLDGRSLYSLDESLSDQSIMTSVEYHFGKD